jgi:hypothetical protein
MLKLLHQPMEFPNFYIRVFAQNQKKCAIVF